MHVSSRKWLSSRRWLPRRGFEPASFWSLVRPSHRLCHHDCTCPPRPYSAVSSYFAFAPIRILNLPNRILVLPIQFTLYVLFLDVNLTTNSWKMWKYKANIEYQTEENRVMTTETDFLELKIWLILLPKFVFRFCHKQFPITNFWTKNYN